MLTGTLNKSFGQFVRFLIVGLFATVVNYSIFYLLYIAAGFYYVMASGAGFIAGVVAGLPLNWRWTFGAQDTQKTPLILKYIVVYTASLVLSLILLAGLVRYTMISPLYVNMFVIFVTTCTNFIGIKRWTFRM